MLLDQFRKLPEAMEPVGQLGSPGRWRGSPRRPLGDTCGRAARTPGEARETQEGDEALLAWKLPGGLQTNSRRCLHPEDADAQEADRRANWHDACLVFGGRRQRHRR